MAYDAKFKARVIRYRDAGHTFKEVKEAFGVDRKRYWVWKEQLAKHGKFVTNYPKTHAGKIDVARLMELYEAHPDWYLREFAAEFGVCLQAIQQKFIALGVNRKKKTFLYSEKSEEKRDEYLRKVEGIPVEKRVYVDECGIRSDLKREYGWSLRGKKIEDTKRGHSYHRTNVVAAQIHTKAGVQKIAPWCYTSTMKAALFETWVETTLLPVVEKGSTIIMDNARFHRKAALESICKKAEVNLLFLPAYSPDLNPIEKSWANMKRSLRDSAPLCGLLETAIYQYWR